MIVTFYDETFNGLQNNASLVIDNASYSLTRRAVDLDELKCTCEAFTENIQPTFVVIKNDRGNYVYGALAGVPQLTEDNQTKITASDLKTMLKSDVLLDLSQEFSDVNAFLKHVFSKWNEQVTQGSFTCELVFNDNVGTIAFEFLAPAAETWAVYDAWEDIFAPYLKYYGLFMVAELDLVAKKVVFRIGISMYRDVTVKLWEWGIYDYGKWVADVNETQGYVLNTTMKMLTAGTRWILTSQNKITNDSSNRDIYPIKRRITFKETDDTSEVEALKTEADTEALKELVESMYQENIEIEGLLDRGQDPIVSLESRFNVVVRRGEAIYKSLPCGELQYDAAGLKKVKIGFRTTGISFIL
nr:MAG TPA: hypothetical protein [Caudoviricetes sp.]